MNADDERFLSRAIEPAGAAREAGNAPFGSLLVSAAGEILVEDVNTVATERDITAHPEPKLAAGRPCSTRRAGRSTATARPHGR
jgi:tRNA(Arg) A34 adenosine deaminase TadA